MEVTLVKFKNLLEENYEDISYGVMLKDGLRDILAEEDDDDGRNDRLNNERTLIYTLPA